MKKLIVSVAVISLITLEIDTDRGGDATETV